MSCTEFANLLAKTSLTDAKKRVAFPTSKPPPGCPGRIIPSMNCQFNSWVCWVRWTEQVTDKRFFFFVLQKMLNRLSLRQENTFLKGLYGNSFCNRARDKPFCTAAAEGNDHLSYSWRKFTLLPKPWLFSQKLCSSGCMLELLLEKVFTSEHGLIFLGKSLLSCGCCEGGGRVGAN